MVKDELVLPCLKGNMGDWIYFSVIMPLQDVATRIHYPKEVYTNKKLSDMIQRSLDSNRSSRIKEYLLQNADRFFGSLIVGAYGGRPKWYGLDNLDSSKSDLKNLLPSATDSLGFIKLTGEENLFAIDGQHRLSGIREALKENKELQNELISVILVAHKETPEGILRTRKLFVSLNKHAVKVNKKDIIALDEIDNYAILTRKLVEEYKPFTNRLIDFSGATNLKVNDTENITTITNLYDCVETLVPHIDNSEKEMKRSDFKRYRLEDDHLEALFKNLTDFFDICFDLIPELKEIKENLDSKIIRKHRNAKGGHLLYRPVGWSIFTSVLTDYLKNGESYKDSIKHILENIDFTLSSFPFKETIWQNNTINLKQKTLCRDLILNDLFELSHARQKNIAEKYKQHTGKVLTT